MTGFDIDPTAIADELLAAEREGESTARKKSLPLVVGLIVVVDLITLVLLANSASILRSLPSTAPSTGGVGTALMVLGGIVVAHVWGVHDFRRTGRPWSLAAWSVPLCVLVGVGWRVCAQALATAFPVN